MTPEAIPQRRATCRRLGFEPHPESVDSHQARPEIVLLTGESGVGKTTYCSRIVDHARKQGLVVAGLLTPRRPGRGGKAGLDVEDIRTGQRRPLAEPVVVDARGPAIGKWRFHAESLDWGTEILRCATPCDVLLIDELGPLELTRNLGWTVAMDVLRAGRYRMAAVVVRPALVAAFQEQIDPLHSRAIVLTESNRCDLGPEISSLLGAES